MTIKRLLLASLVILSVAAGCASDPPPAAAEGGTEEGVDAEPSGADAARRAGTGRSRRDGGRMPTTNERGEEARRTTSGSGAGEDGGTEDDFSSAYVPAAGNYVYDQDGTEEFCDTTSCDEKNLPPTQEVKTFYRERSGDTTVVVTEARASHSRFVRTTTRHSPRGAFITNVQIRFDYEGFSFDNSYQPDPPVEALRYPLRSGASWSGKWKDRTSGDYSVDVDDKQSVSVSGRSVQAFPLRTVTSFTGEFEGTAEVILWIDPATSAVVKTSGELRVKSVFGSYHTVFTSALRSGPGYR